MKVLDKSWSAAMIVLVVGGLYGALAIGLRGCATADPQPSTMVWDGSGYVIAWAAPQDGRSVIYTFRAGDDEFGKRDVNLLVAAAPNRLLAVDDVTGPPEIAVADDGMMVFVNATNGDLLTAPVSMDGSAAGTVQRIERNVKTVCPAPVGVGSGYVGAWILEENDRSILRLAFLDAHGSVVESMDYPTQATECAVGADSGRVGLISREPHSYSLSLRSIRSDSHFRTDLREDSGETALLRVPSTRSAEPLRLIAMPGGWALLLGDRSRSARVILVDQELNEKSSFAIDDVDPSSIDIAVNRGGVLASWIDAKDSKLELVKLSATGAFEKRYELAVGSNTHGTRALGPLDHCAATWTSMFGRTANVVRAKGCLTPD